jgi:ABC-2 type transport system ATP-binding protein|nr:ABC transporter ATP-binding protein [Candidatus Krumholzibacteria bacterium]
MSVIDLTGVTRGYGSEKVLTDMDLRVAKGEVVGLLGRNGAGKTTLIRLIMGLIAPWDGTVEVFGLDPRKEPMEVKRRIGFVAEDQELPKGLKVHQVITMHRELFPHWDAHHATTLAERFALPPDRKIKDLSKGQARQVALLCAVCHRPELLILDEPAGGLDPAARREFLETSIQLLVDEECTILFSSHHMSDIERMASRLVMIHDHQKWIDSEVDAIREGYCLAQVPREQLESGERLLEVEGCLCSRSHGAAWHAVFEREPDSCARELKNTLGLGQVMCRTIDLEEMFIELAGRSS